MFASIQSFFCMNPNLNGSINSETNSKDLTERSINSDLFAEWVINPDPIVSAIYTATERQAAFPQEIVNLVTEYLQNHEALKSLSMFGPADWKTTFNKKVEMIQPPPKMDAFLQRINSFTGKLNAESCLCVFVPSHYQDIPRNTKEDQELINLPLIPLTPATMEELAKNPSNPKNQSKFSYFLSNDNINLTNKEIEEARKEFLNLQAKKSYWVCIMASAISDNWFNSGYWEIPSLREAIICAFANYAKTGFRILNDEPLKYQWCYDKIKGYKTYVGGFNSSGLCVDSFDTFQIIVSYFSSTQLNTLHFQTFT